MNALGNFGNLVENLAGNIEAVMDDREEMLSEISILRERLMKRDKEAVKAAQNMRAELEAAQVVALHFEQEWIRMEAKLQNLNDRLIALAGDEKCCGS